MVHKHVHVMYMYKCIINMYFVLCMYICAAWFLYSVILLVLLSIGLVFYYLFKDTQFYGVHVWSFFM